VKNRSLTGKDIKKSSLGTTEVKDRSLLAKDFKAGQLPAGAQGPKGDKGAKGDKGNPGQDGPAGTARAYVVGGVGCHTAVDFCTLTRNKNVAYVAHVGQGTYCVGVNGIDASAPDSLALVSVAETGSGDYLDTASWRRVNAACAPTEFEVQTRLVGSLLVRNAADNGSVEVSGFGHPIDDEFSIVIP
jgi:hypothetical protein